MALGGASEAQASTFGLSLPQLSTWVFAALLVVIFAFVEKRDLKAFGLDGSTFGSAALGLGVCALSKKPDLKHPRGDLDESACAATSGFCVPWQRRHANRGLGESPSRVLVVLGCSPGTSSQHLFSGHVVDRPQQLACVRTDRGSVECQP